MLVAGREDVQEEAVLRRAGLAERRRQLWAVWRELCCVAHARPAGGRLRWLPPQRADRRGGVRDAAKLIDRSIGQATNWPVGGAYDRPAGGRLPAEDARAHCGRRRDQGTQGYSGYGQPGARPPSGPSHTHLSLPSRLMSAITLVAGPLHAREA